MDELVRRRDRAIRMLYFDETTILQTTRVPFVKNTDRCFWSESEHLSTSIYCWSNYFISEHFFCFLFGNKIELLNFASTNYRFFFYPDGRDLDSNTCIFTNEKTVCFTVRQDIRDFFFGNEIQQVRLGASNGDANMR